MAVSKYWDEITMNFVYRKTIKAASKIPSEKLHWIKKCKVYTGYNTVKCTSVHMIDCNVMINIVCPTSSKIRIKNPMWTLTQPDSGNKIQTRFCHHGRHRKSKLIVCIAVRFHSIAYIKWHMSNNRGTCQYELKCLKMKDSDVLDFVSRICSRRT